METLYKEITIKEHLGRPSKEEILAKVTEILKIDNLQEVNMDVETISYTYIEFIEGENK